jgi:hypothetical protein
MIYVTVVRNEGNIIRKVSRFGAVGKWEKASNCSPEIRWVVIRYAVNGLTTDFT